MTCFLKAIDSTPMPCFALIIQHMTFGVKTIRSILVPTTATLCYWHRMMVLDLLHLTLFVMLVSWAYTMQISSSPGQSLVTINQDIWNSFGSDGSSSWKSLLLQVSRTALLIKEGLYRQMHLRLMLLRSCHLIPVPNTCSQGVPTELVTFHTGYY